MPRTPPYRYPAASLASACIAEAHALSWYAVMPKSESCPENSQYAKCRWSLSSFVNATKMPERAAKLSIFRASYVLVESHRPNLYRRFTKAMLPACGMLRSESARWNTLPAKN